MQSGGDIQKIGTDIFLCTPATSMFPEILPASVSMRSMKKRGGNG